MPNVSEILDGLKAASNDALPVAVLWHVMAAAAIVALLRGWRPSRRLAAMVLAAPIASAASVAFVHRNPFNGSVLGGLAVALIGLGARMDRSPVRRAPLLAPIGVGLLVFGLVYPHFLEGSAALFLVAAPAGIIPCPTLSLVIGFALIAGGLGARAWSIVLASAGLFYGLFGVLRLGVGLDVGLIAGATVLLLASLHATVRGARSATARRLGGQGWPSQ